MPVEPINDGLEPEDNQSAIWRFMNLEKFSDMIRSRELYFCRADLFKDESEGMPPEKHVLNVSMNTQERNHLVGTIAQYRQGFFVNCWHLFVEETARMWRDYGQAGVAVCSRYSLLKKALDSCRGRALIGLVRYGFQRWTRWNLIQFVMTKDEQYSHEREVRAVFWFPEYMGEGNRHFDEHNNAYPLPLTDSLDAPRYQRFRVDLQSLVTEIAVSPFAPESLLCEVEQLVSESGLSIPVRLSELAQYKHVVLP